jgi:hypothetical protein
MIEKKFLRLIPGKRNKLNEKFFVIENAENKILFPHGGHNTNSSIQKAIYGNSNFTNPELDAWITKSLNSEKMAEYVTMINGTEKHVAMFPMAMKTDENLHFNKTLLVNPMTIMIIHTPKILTIPLGEYQKKSIALSVVCIIYVMLLALSCIFFLAEDLIIPFQHLNNKMSEIMSMAQNGKDGSEGEIDID